MNALEVRGLKVTYGSGPSAFTAVEAATLELPERCTLGLVGESGSGKSTIARALVGLAPVRAGEVRLFGEPVPLASRRGVRRMRRGAQLVFQDPYASLNPRMTVRRAIEDVVRIHAGRCDAGWPTGPVELLDAVSIGEDALERYPHEFSGGQLQRIAIARALAAQPRILIADEVTSALDVSVQAIVLNLLKELQLRFGFSCLFISHNVAVVRYMSDTVAVMQAGRIVERAGVETLFSNARHPYTRTLLDSLPGRLAEVSSR